MCKSVLVNETYNHVVGSQKKQEAANDQATKLIAKLQVCTLLLVRPEAIRREEVKFVQPKSVMGLHDIMKASELKLNQIMQLKAQRQTPT